MNWPVNHSFGCAMKNKPKNNDKITIKKQINLLLKGSLLNGWMNDYIKIIIKLVENIWIYC